MRWGTLAMTVVAVLAATMTPGCLCLSCPSYGMTIEATVPGLFIRLTDGAIANDGHWPAPSTKVATGPDWLASVTNRATPNVTVSLTHSTFFTDRFSLQWKDDVPEADARHAGLEMLELGGYPSARLVLSWEPQCTDSKCQQSLEFDRRSFTPYLDAFLDSSPRQWSDESLARQHGYSTPWIIEFEYAIREAEVRVGDATVGIEASSSGHTDFRVTWTDGRKEEMTGDQGRDAARAALEKLGLDPTTMQELEPFQVVPPPAAREAPVVGQPP